MAENKLGTPARESERVLLRIPIRVEGEDILGNHFEEITYTLVVNQSGGHIAVSHPLEAGAKIRITNLKTQACCSFQVVMRVPRSLSGSPEWGVKCLEPEAQIWGVYFPTRTQEPATADLIHVLLECQDCYSREVATLTVQQYRRLAAESSLSRPCAKCNATSDWQCAVIEAEAEEALGRVPAPVASAFTPRCGAEKRREKRLVIKLPVGLRLLDGSEETTTTENISKSGMCFACNLELQIGDRVYVSVGTSGSGEEREIPARVVWRRPARDKGRAFYGVKLEGPHEAVPAPPSS